MSSVEPLGGLTPYATGYTAVSGGARIYWELYGNPPPPEPKPAGAQPGSDAAKADGGPTQGQAQAQAPITTGRVLLLINGFGGKIPFMGFVVQRFVRLGYQVLVHEARGLGRSAPGCPPGRQTTRLLARDALAVADAVVGPGGAFYLMGVSMGGMVCQELLHRLVATGRTSRLRAAFLVVTSPGKRWRALPWRRAARARRETLPAMRCEDDEALAARLPGMLGMLHDQAFLDGPAPPQPGARGAKPPPAAAAAEGEQAGGDPASAAAKAEPPTRRDVLTDMWQQHWRSLTCMTPEEMDGVLWHATAHQSHHMGPRRLAAIRRSGMRVGVGIAAADVVHPPAEQRWLAERLGSAEVHEVGRGHCDGCVLDGTAALVGAALAAFGDSRV
ncbi:hypothetical protein HYH03_018485 [Edaphochlamys debaryana]|uniref:Serine aminopeptidase S33 domain-containing protein n=1 Tax=Edaphochlamys debaryana TaxID=47281 RepID=A0A835XHV2_9CHLO|nr:hypothetical protein HYH03_018485 [Edaphochlamys debaryana]|eukprot:KAG2482601.1 hypothetical protein HYH03_018485 [Edaphochlamys debaryana]